VHWTSNVYKALILLVVIAVGARLIAGLLGPVLPSLLMLAIVAVVVMSLVRGPHAKK
jgi:hypothetical protein